MNTHKKSRRAIGCGATVHPAEIGAQVARGAVAVVIERHPTDPPAVPPIYSAAEKLQRAAACRRDAATTRRSEAARLIEQAEQLENEADRPRMLKRPTPPSLAPVPVYVLRIEASNGAAAFGKIPTGTPAALVQDARGANWPHFVALADLAPETAEDLRRLADEIAETMPETARALRFLAHDEETKHTPRRATIEAARLRNIAAEIEASGDARPYFTNCNGTREEAERIAASERRRADEIEASDRRQMQDDRAALYVQRTAEGFAECITEDGTRLATFGTPAAPFYAEFREYRTGSKRARVDYHLTDPATGAGHGLTIAAPTFAELLETFARQIKEKGAELVRQEIAAEIERRQRAADQLQAERLRRYNGQ